MAQTQKIDGHLHVWAPKEKSGEFPYYGALIGSDSAANEPPLPGYAELLKQEMKSAGIDKSVIVQPGNHMFDHTYVSYVLKEFPNDFVGVLLANPGKLSPFFFLCFALICFASRLSLHFVVGHSNLHYGAFVTWTIIIFQQRLGPTLVRSRWSGWLLKRDFAAFASTPTCGPRERR